MKIMNFQCIVLLVCFPFCLTEYNDFEEVEDIIPKPYNFGYEVHDQHGDQWRTEESDGIGHVRGSYGFVDEEGKRRAVEYVADDNGFRARIKTNEAGIDFGHHSPANIQIVEDYEDDAAVYGLENVQLPVRTGEKLPVRAGGKLPVRAGGKYYKYQVHAEKSAPPIYVVDGHLQSPWFPMDTVAQI